MSGPLAVSHVTTSSPSTTVNVTAANCASTAEGYLYWERIERHEQRERMDWPARAPSPATPRPPLVLLRAPRAQRLALVVRHRSRQVRLRHRCAA